MRYREIAGPRLKITPLTTEIASVNPSTLGSMRVSARRGTICEPKLAIIDTANLANSNPEAPPSSAKTMPSVRNCLITRMAPAPIADRMAISLCLTS